ncbi:hypothetical protein SUZIE_208245 [Sciurus carolinensis]|uniref:Uncharacterized protein n=1 Tax=Sciurus carolinensis TaxID=30640 RepID=A0AA41NHI0_SCICA|nr:uncharacterized protein C10orf95 homolog [Sciurus carolinensis]MBZ3890495.1 hypothetical protein [Sciurus carolinensis]
MYSYVCLPPGESVWPPLQPLSYAYLPAPLLLPPIQAHNFCSRPASLSVGEWAAPREYHRFYGPGASLFAAPPCWAFPPAYAAALGSAVPAARVVGSSLQESAAESWAPWPEGGSIQTELRWGRVERPHGQGLQLPHFVCRELRRVYGTYPRTDVRVTYSRGEFLVQAAPRVGKPEYRVERRVLRRPDSRDSSSPAREAVERGRPKKPKGLG